MGHATGICLVFFFFFSVTEEGGQCVGAVWPSLRLDRRQISMLISKHLALGSVLLSYPEEGGGTSRPRNNV